jgi:hypothetical protein
MEFLSWRLLEQCLVVTLHMNSLEFRICIERFSNTCIYTLSIWRKIKLNYIKLNTAYFGPHTMEHLRICWNIDPKYHFVGSGLLRMMLIRYSCLLGRGLCKGWVGGWVIQWKLASCMACLKSAYVNTKNVRKDRQDGALFATSELGSGERRRCRRRQRSNVDCRSTVTNNACTARSGARKYSMSVL